MTKSILVLTVFLSTTVVFAQPVADQMSAAAPASKAERRDPETPITAKGTETETDVGVPPENPERLDKYVVPARHDGDEAPPPILPPRARLPNDPFAPDIAPLSYQLGYGLRLDRNHHLQNGFDAGAELRLIPHLSAQFKWLFGYRTRDDFGDGDDWHHKDDFWSLFNLGLKWNPIVFTLINHPADLFVTAGGLTSTSTGSAFTQGSALYVGVGGTYYFERNVKGVLDVRAAPGRSRQYGQLSVAINFQF